MQEVLCPGCLGSNTKILHALTGLVRAAFATAVGLPEANRVSSWGLKKTGCFQCKNALTDLSVGVQNAPPTLPPPLPPIHG